MELTDKWCIRGGQYFTNFIKSYKRSRKTINVAGYKDQSFYYLTPGETGNHSLELWDYIDNEIPTGYTLISFEEFLQLINKEGHQNNNNYQIY